MSRRRFLAGTALAVTAAACSDRGSTRSGGGDLDVASIAAGMEKALVDIYATTRMSAVQGRLGAAIPQALVEYLTTAGSHHQAHLNTWNGVLTAGGRAVVDAADEHLRAAVDAAVLRVVDIPGLAGLAVRLEDYASRTYLQAIPTLTVPDNIRSAGQMLVVDAQHQAFLRYVVGLYPVGSGTGTPVRDFAPADPSTGLLT